MRSRTRVPWGLVTACAGLLAAAATWSETSQVRAAEPAAAGSFRAACVKIDITPDSPQWMQGYGPRKSEGVHDRIFHRIAALDDGTTTFFLVSTEVCSISPSYYDDYCQKLEKENGVRPEQIWWATTHTHSAPHLGPQDLGRLFVGTLGDRFSIDHDAQYWEWVTRKLTQGILEARARLEPARLGVAVGTAQANVNRRERKADGQTVLGVNVDGPIDRQLGVLRLERMDGSLIGLIANYAIHGTALGGENKQISGDVPGWTASYVEEKLGVPMLFINGAEGNAAPLHSVGGDIHSPLLPQYTALLGDPILKANESMVSTTADVTLSIGKTVIETPRKSGLAWLDELAAYASVAPDGTNCVRLPIYSLMINRDTVIWAAPLELFSEIAINVRQASPFKNTLYFGLTNGTLIYLPTKAAFTEGGYEPNVSPFSEQAETDLTNGVTQYLQELKRRGDKQVPR